jgi:iron complex outermembrane receptor protein
MTRWLPFTLVAALLLAATAFAETVDTLTGVVVDQSGGPVAGATVTLLNKPSGQARVVTTDERGAFTLTAVPSGRHALRVEKEQFSTEHVEVIAGSDAALSPIRVVLTVAGVHETVNVAGILAPYVKPTAAMASKTDTPIMQTPFAVEAVPSQVITDQQALQLSDVTRNVSGVQPSWGAGQEYEGFALRGFATHTTLRNGQRAAGIAGRTSIDLATVESVEVLKGPAAMLYGRMEPGGLVNIVTKPPLPTPRFAIQQQVGSRGLSRTTLDATGPITPDGSLLYRVVGQYFRSDSSFTHGPNGRTGLISPSLAWRPHERLQANVNFEYRDVHPLFAYGIPAIGTVPADIPATTWSGDETDSVHTTRKLIEANVSYQLTHKWHIRVAGVANWQRQDVAKLSPWKLDEVPGPTYGTLSNFPWFVNQPGSDRNVSLDVTGRIRTGAVDHTLLIGTDYYSLTYSFLGFVNAFAPSDTVNIFHPTYSRPTGSNAPYRTMPPDWHSVGTSGWNGLYAQDQIGLTDRLHMLIGGRYDWTRMSNRQVLLEYAPPGTSINDLSTTTANETKFSPRLGVLYQPVPSISLYANYVQSLGMWGSETAIGTDVAGQPLPAERSESYEGGVKTEWLGGRLRSTVAVFTITKRNMATRDLSSPNPTALLAIGEARSRGLEVDVSGDLTRRFGVIATYAFDAARLTKDNGGLQNNAIANVPRHSGSLWLKAQVSPALFIGGGAVLRGERPGDNENSFRLPGYLSVDVVAGYAIKTGRSQVIPQVNVTNLTNARYFTSTDVHSGPRTAVMPGQPRTVIGSIRWEY